MTVTVGKLTEGERFKTLLTKRTGVILNKYSEGGDGIGRGILVALSPLPGRKMEIEKSLHPAVVVEV